jgi:hypothetical protein
MRVRQPLLTVALLVIVAALTGSVLAARQAPTATVTLVIAGMT